MAESIQDKIQQSLQAAEELYHRLVLLVGVPGCGKTGVLRDVAETCGTSVINVNLALSRKLLDLTPRQRALRIPEIMDQIPVKSQSLIILDNLEILFDQSLKQDPLRLLQGISRNRTVLASWGGAVNAGRLVYAETDHPEYHRYDSVDALIVGMDGTATVDSTAKQ